MVMKGLELPITIIVIAAVAIIVLVVLMYFLIFQSGKSMSKADADRIFASKCEYYKQNGCNVMEAKKDKTFLSACKVHFQNDPVYEKLSDDGLAFACLKIDYAGATGCCEPVNPDCFWRSSRSEGLFEVGASEKDVKMSCDDLKAFCPDSLTDACV